MEILALSAAIVKRKPVPRLVTSSTQLAQNDWPLVEDMALAAERERERERLATREVTTRNPNMGYEIVIQRHHLGVHCSNLQSPMTI